jgi:hypothetical protein
VGQALGFVLTRLTGCVRILDMHNICFLEAYYNFGSKMDEVEQTFEKEIQLLRGLDAILIPHAILRDYFLTHLAPQLPGVAERTHTVRLGCEPASRLAAFSPQPRGVYAGSYYPIQDPYLLAYLSKISPYPVDCYGPHDPNRTFFPTPLRFKGFAPSVDFLADYQFGLITVSRDVLRQHSPSTKFANYFAHGLPVLFPEWMKEGFEYPDCAIPYNEGNLPEVAVRMADEPTWTRMSRAAQARAAGLASPVVLRPLADLLTHLAPAGPSARVATVTQ